MRSAAATLRILLGASLLGGAASSRALEPEAFRPPSYTNHASNLPSFPFYPVFHGARINDHYTILAEKVEAREGNPL